MLVRILQITGLALIAMVCFRGEAHAQDADAPASPILRPNFDMHAARIDDAAADRAGTLVVTASDDKTARVWTLPDLRPLRVLRPPIGQDNVGEIFAVAVSPDGTLAAIGGWLTSEPDRERVDLFDLGSGRLIRQFQTNSGTHSLAFSKDGQLLAAGLEEGVRAWRLSDGAMQLDQHDYKGTVYGLDFAPGGQLAVASEGGDIRLYDTQLRPVQRKTAELGKQPFRLRFSPDGRDLAVGFEDQPVVEVRAAADLSLRARPDVHGLQRGSLAIVGWSADGQDVLAGGIYNTEGGDNRPVLAWSQRGTGPRRVVAGGFGNTVQAIIGLNEDAVLVGSTRPSLGVFKAGREIVSRPSPVAALYSWGNGDDPARQLFRISYDGTVVETDEGMRRGKPIHLDATTPSVTFPEVASPGLASWQPDEGDLKPKQWFVSEAPQLNDRTLGLKEHERSLAIDVRQGQVLLGSDWTLRLFDSAAREVWPASVPDVAWRVAQAPDGRLVVAALGDGTVRWYRHSDGRELLAILLTADLQRWVAFTPSGYYAASPGGEDLIGWHVNNGPDHAADFFPASRFRDRFYRPDVVSLVLQTLDETQALGQVDAARGNTLKAAPTAQALTQEVLRDRPPVVTVLTPRPGTQLDGDTAALDVEVRSPTGRPITRLEARVNGRPVDAQLGDPQPIAATIPGEHAERRHLAVPVPAGQDASLQVIAWSDNRASEAATIQVRGRPVPQAAPALPKPRLNAVLVGVSAYKDPDLQLKFAAKDAQDLAKALKKQEGGLYREVNLHVLSDAQATRDTILQELDWLQRETTHIDSAILFLAGHGLPEDEDYYFLPADADADTIVWRGLSGTDLRLQLRKVPGHTFVFLDACYAGALLNARDVPLDINKFVNELSSAEAGVAVYSATTGRQRALELPTLQNGVFTHALLDVLAGRVGHHGADALRINVLANDLAEDVKSLTDGRQATTFNAIGPQQNLPLFLVRQ